MSSSKVATLTVRSTDERRVAAETSCRVKLIRHRRARAWTHEQLAAWLGCSVDAVQLWESGKRRVPGWPVEALEQDRSLFLPENTAQMRGAAEPREETPHEAARPKRAA